MDEKLCEHERIFGTYVKLDEYDREIGRSHTWVCNIHPYCPYPDRICHVKGVIK